MDPENPYATPSAPPRNPALSAGQLSATPFVTVGQGKRFANLLIDWVATTVISVVAGLAIGLLLGSTMSEDTLGLVGNLVGFVVVFGYYTFMEGTTGRTFGKMATGTKVVDANGNPPTIGKAFLRTLCRMIPFEPFSFLGKEARGWHDSITKTWVIEAR